MKTLKHVLAALVVTYFAKIENGVVTSVIVAEPAVVAKYRGTWVQTWPEGGPGKRKNYAGVGFAYDEMRDCFIPPQPYPSWVLDEALCTWSAPAPRADIWSRWNEATRNWTPK